MEQYAYECAGQIGTLDYMLVVAVLGAAVPMADDFSRDSVQVHEFFGELSGKRSHIARRLR